MTKHYNTLEYANHTIAILKDFGVKLDKETKAQIRGFKTAEEVDSLRSKLQRKRLEEYYDVKRNA